MDTTHNDNRVIILPLGQPITILVCTFSRVLLCKFIHKLATIFNYFQQLKKYYPHKQINLQVYTFVALSLPVVNFHVAYGALNLLLLPI